MTSHGELKRGFWALWMVCVAGASRPGHGLAAEKSIRATGRWIELEDQIALRKAASAFNA
jgi:hypothetical protein